MRKKVAIIGGGAAGMMAAIQAAREGALVTIYERNEKVGKKILATGNGKCNFSNEKMEATAYYGSAVSLLPSLFAQFGVAETKQFFEQLGMRIKDRNGYLYPASEQAATVLDVLRFEVERLGICVCTDCLVTDITYHKKQNFTIQAETKTAGVFDAVILCCGGKAAPKTGSDGMGFRLAKKLGHHIIKPVPALMALRCKGDFWKSISGVRCDAGVTLWIDGKKRGYDKGELQLTDYGISGIPVFQISREAAYGLEQKKCTVVEIAFLPDATDNEYELFWQQRWRRQADQNMELFSTGIVNKKITMMLLKMADISPKETAASIPLEKRRKLEELYRSFPVEVVGTNSFEQAQICAGGIPAGELSAGLGSILVPGLYFAGEIIDIDGICGGYNLQWAWTSGTIAGKTAARA